MAPILAPLTELHRFILYLIAVRGLIALRRLPNSISRDRRSLTRAATPHLSFLARPVAATKVKGFGWPRAVSRQPSA
jgi:hypothetical protein